MKIIYRRFVASFLIVAFIWCLPVADQPAEANPGVIALGVIGLGSLLVAAGAVNYYQPAVLPGLAGGASSFYSTAGNILRIGMASYGNWQNSTTATIENKLVTLQIFAVDLQRIAGTGDTGLTHKYPALHSALTTSNAPILSSTNVAGDVVTIPGIGVHEISGSIAAACVPLATAQSGPYNITATGCNVDGTSGNAGLCGSDLLTVRYQVSYPSTVVPPPIVANPPAFAQAAMLPPNYSGTTTNSPIAPGSSYQGDIDQLIHDNPNVVHYVDSANPDTDKDTLVPPYAAPTSAFNPAAATPSQATALQAGITAQTALHDAQTAAATAAAAAAANPTDPKLANAAATAAAVASALAAQQAQTAAQIAASDKAGTTTSQDTSTPSVTVPGLEKIDFSPFLGLQGVLSTKFPFTLLSQVASFLGFFTATPAPPVFNLKMPIGPDMVIDLTPFDPVAIIARFVVEVLLSIGVILYVVRRFIS